MKTTNAITIRNILILLVGACYCVVGRLFLANSALIEAFIGWLPLTMYVISAIIVVPIVLKNRGAWDEWTPDYWHHHVGLWRTNHLVYAYGNGEKLN